jgi:hypothetical protein
MVVGKVVVVMVALVNVRNSLVVDRQGIEVFGSVFDLLGFEGNGIREVVV